MLDPRRELTLRQLWLQKIPRLLASLLAWALIYQLWQMGRYDGGITSQELAEAVKQVLAFHHQNHLYYLHMALLVYALLPVTRIITAHADRHTLEYLLILWAVLGILYPAFKGCWPLTLLRGIPTQYGLNLAYTGAGYGLLGWYLRQYAASPRRWVLTAAAGFLVIFGGTALLSLKDGGLNEALLEAASPGTAGRRNLRLGLLRSEGPADNAITSYPVPGILLRVSGPPDSLLGAGTAGSQRRRRPMYSSDPPDCRRRAGLFSGSVGGSESCSHGGKVSCISPICIFSISLYK